MPDTNTRRNIGYSLVTQYSLVYPVRNTDCVLLEILNFDSNYIPEEINALQ